MKNIYVQLFLFISAAVFGAAFGQTSPVKMNEIYSRGTDSDPDWIELYNASSDTIDISKYKIYDNGGQSGSKSKKTFASGTVIPPKGFYVAVTDGSDSSDFGLSNSGEEVWLEDGAGTVIQDITFPALKSGESYCRVPDGGDTWEILTTQTKGSLNSSATAVTDSKSAVYDFRLNQNYPNPFNPQTKITYSLKDKGNVQLNVYNLIGQLVCRLVNSFQEAGSYSATFNGTNFSSGVYVYELKVSSTSGSQNVFTASKKFVLMK